MGNGGLKTRKGSLVMCLRRSASLQFHWYADSSVDVECGSRSPSIMVLLPPGRSAPPKEGPVANRVLSSMHVFIIIRGFRNLPLPNLPLHPCNCSNLVIRPFMINPFVLHLPRFLVMYKAQHLCHTDECRNPESRVCAPI